MTDTTASALRIAANYTDRNPTLAQKESGNYAKGKFPWNGLTIAIENPKGSERSGVDKGGKSWRVKMPAHYGYVLGSVGSDKDHVDVYIGDAHDARTVFVIDQIDAGTDKFDEHKCLLDFPDKDAALITYGRAFSDGKAKDRIGAVNEMTVDQFKRWVMSGDTKKPLGHNAKGYKAGGVVNELIERAPAPPDGPSWFDNLPRAQQAEAADALTFDSVGSPWAPWKGGATYYTPRTPHVLPDDFLSNLVGRESVTRTRNAYAAGGAVSMPLIKSGSKAAVSSNIKEMQAAGRPHDQAVAAALSTARRYAKASGGRVGYAEGGNADSDKLNAAVANYIDRTYQRPDMPWYLPESAVGDKAYRYQGVGLHGGLGVLGALAARMAGKRGLPTGILKGTTAYNAGYVPYTIGTGRTAARPDVGPVEVLPDAPYAQGGPVGYGPGGWVDDGATAKDMTRDILPPRPRSPVPEYLLKQIRGLQEEREARSNEPGPVEFSRVPALDVAAAMTGLPSIYEGIGHLRNPDSDNWDRAKGAGQVMLGAVPGLAALRSPIAKELAGTMPRMLGLTTAASDAPREGSSIAKEILGISEAKAQSAKGKDGAEQLTPHQIRARQQILVEEGILPKADADGKWGKGSQDVWDERERRIKKKDQDAAAAMRATEKAKAEAEAKKTEDQRAIAESAEREAKRIADEGKDETRKKEVERYSKLMHDDAGYLKRMLRASPEAVGAVGAGLLGKGIGFGLGQLFKRPAAQLQSEANKLLEPVTGKGKQLEEVSRTNAFWAKGGSEEPFLVNRKAVPPYKSNEAPGVLPAGELYAPKSIKPEAIIQGSIAAAPLYESVKSYQELGPAQANLNDALKAFNADPTQATYENYVKAADHEAWTRALLSGGVGYTAGHGSGTALSLATRKNPQPDIHAGSALRLKLEEKLGKAEVAKAKAADAAKAADKAKKQRAKARKEREAIRAETPKKPNGAAAPLLPLAAMPLIEGSRGSSLEGPASQLSDATSSAFSPYDEPYADGGVTDKHHSNFQPRDDQSRFVGGPVYPDPAPTVGRQYGGMVNKLQTGIRAALDTARRYASGGKVVVGPVVGATGGRTDALPVDVAAGSYVLPADVVSALGEGNTMAGHKAIDKMFGRAAHGAGDAVPIKISDGEHVLSREQVMKIGRGDYDQGCAALDQFVKMARKKNIETLSQLPGPHR